LGVKTKDDIALIIAYHTVLTMYIQILLYSSLFYDPK